MSLAWTEEPWWAKDGYHEGVRVAAVECCWVPIQHTVVRSKFWMAFVRQPDFEIVLVGGEPGRWATEPEARAAAERAFDA